MRRRPPCVLQRDSSDCGAACLATVSLHYGQDASVAKLREAAGTTLSGTNILGLTRAAEALGFEAKGVKGKASGLEKVPLPAIARISRPDGGHHFVVLFQVRPKRVTLADPAQGTVSIPRAEFESLWDGVLLLLEPKGELDARFKRASLWGRFFRIVATQRAVLAEAVIASLLMTLIGLGTAYFVGQLVDTVLPNGLSGTLSTLAILVLVLGLTKILMGAFQQYLIAQASQKMDLHVMDDFYLHVHRLPLRFFHTRQVGDILSRFQDGLRIRDSLTSWCTTLCQDLILLAGGLCALFLLHLKLAIVLLAFLPPIVGVSLLFVRPLRERNRRLLEQGAEVSAHLVESTANAGLIRAAGGERRRHDEFGARMMRQIRTGLSISRLEIWASSLSSVFHALASLGLYWYGGQTVIRGELSLGELIFAASVLGYVYNPVLSLVGVYLDLQETKVSMDRLGEIMELDPEPTSGRAPAPRQAAPIRFQDVSFGYHHGLPVLKGLSFEVAAGEMVAVKGESGSGKSTMLALIPRLLERQSGAILVGGQDVRDIPPHELRRSIGYVPQDAGFFAGTIFENLSLGADGASWEAVERAAQAAGIHDFVTGLPERYETRLAERGQNLSAGQRQRLAIARALVPDPPILLLDEVTSNLDAESEERLLRALEALKGAKTIVLVTHRSSTATRANRVIVLREGRIETAGSPDRVLTEVGRSSREPVKPTPLNGAIHECRVHIAHAG